MFKWGEYICSEICFLHFTSAARFVSCTMAGDGMFAAHLENIDRARAEDNGQVVSTPVKTRSTAVGLLMQSPGSGASSPGSVRSSPGSAASGSTSALCLGVPRTAFAKKAPKLPRTGNKDVDDQADSNRGLLMDIIDVCLDDPKHILPLFGSLKKRIAEAAAPTGPGFFITLTVVASLDDTFILVWLESVSDFTSEELLAIKKCDPQAPYLLYEFGTQLPQQLKPPQECRSMEVMLKVSNARHEMCGFRLRTFKKDSSFDIANPAVQFRVGCYVPTWEKEAPHAMKQLVHTSTGLKIDADEQNKMITKACTIKNNHSDILASFRIPIFPDLPMANFFTGHANQGPNKYTQIKGGECKKFTEMVDSIVRTMSQDKHVLNTEKASAIVTGVAKQQHEVDTANFNKARETAKSRSDVRKRKREFTA